MNASRSTIGERYALDLTECARGATSPREFQAHALVAFRALLNSDRAIYVAAAGEPALTTLDVEEPARRLIEYCEQNFTNYSAEVAAAMTAAQELGGLLDLDFFSIHERSKMAFYAEIVRPQHVDSMIVLIPQWKGRSLGMMRLERSGHPRLHRDQLELALRLLPALEVGIAALSGEPAYGQAPLSKLSQRESEIARHVARGLTTPQIALLLGTSKLTVRNQIGKIFDKAGVSSRSELAAWVARKPR